MKLIEKMKKNIVFFLKLKEYMFDFVVKRKHEGKYNFLVF